MKNEKITQTFLTTTFTEWMRNGLPYLNAARDKTRALFEQGRVHTPFFESTYTYEQRYIIKQLAKELYRWM